jgi:TfoX/Sxy family transcriptional regulator of competence genes
MGLNMATDQRTVALILDRLSGLEDIAASKMFGEYGLSCGGKHVGVICNDQLYIKPTAPGRAIAADAQEEPPYRGAKPSLLIAPERWDDSEWMVRLVRATADALPMPKPKRKKQDQ